MSFIQEAIAKATEASDDLRYRDYDSAIEKLTEAIKIWGQDSRFFINRSLCFYEKGQFYQALKDANRAIELNPSNPKGFYRKGCSLLKLKRFRDAEKALKKALEYGTCGGKFSITQ